MWQSTVALGEIVLRTILVYFFLIVLLRITGKRQVGQLAPFDLVLLLVLANSVQNSMTGGDNSLHAGLLSAATLVGANYLVGFATFKSRKIESLVEGRPEVLIYDGRLFEDVMRKAQLTHHELESALRQGGCACKEEVFSAILENNGAISVISNASRAEVAKPEGGPAGVSSPS
ncbi:MAG: YetF domain-containing protein [Thermoanaerobaculia bacterium]